MATAGTHLGELFLEVLESPVNPLFAPIDPIPVGCTKSNTSSHTLLIQLEV